MPTCTGCGREPAHLFPGAEAGAQVCSACYERLRLHTASPLWTWAGYAAIGLGGLLLVLCLIAAYQLA